MGNRVYQADRRAKPLNQRYLALKDEVKEANFCGRNSNRAGRRTRGYKGKAAR